MNPDDWGQDLFDLLCNERVHIEVVGQFGEVYAKLEIDLLGTGRWYVCAEGNGETFDDAMRDLMKNYAVRNGEQS